MINYLRNDIIGLRALEIEDLNFLYDTENNSKFWEVSGTQVPYSKHLLKQYLNNAHLDIYEAKQLRLVIFDADQEKSIGLVDLFDFNPQHLRAGVGIVILDRYQNQNYAYEALKLVINYAFTQLNLHQLYANIPTDNKKSIRLFEKLSFDKVGTRKDWLQFNNSFKDVNFYQIINSK